MTPKTTRALLIVTIALAGPAVFGVDLLARRVVLSGQPADVVEFMAEHVTRIAWFIVPAPWIGGVVGFCIYPGIYRRSLHAETPSSAASSATGPSERDRQRADFKALLVATTLAQLPALLGDVSVMLGARLAPAICATCASVIAVIVIGAFAGRSITS